MIRLALVLGLALPACLTTDDAPREALSASASAPATSASPAAPAPPDEAPDGRLAVVELFTSEGCSSCPPADVLLATLADRPDVVALSFHVDYWDGLGWRDPFSSALATARQRAYARNLDGRVYTPEMVVGGTVGFVGSRRGEARASIAEALGRPSSVQVEVAAQHDGRNVEATYTADGLTDGQVVHVALVQREAESRVVRGENGGRTLRHAHVVRAFETQTNPSGTVRFTLPDGLEVVGALVVAYAQQGEAGAIAGVATTAVE